MRRIIILLAWIIGLVLFGLVGHVEYRDQLRMSQPDATAEYQASQAHP